MFVDCFYYQYQVEIYRFVHAYAGCGPPFHRIANEGLGWNPRTVTLSPGGSAWATLAVALDDPRVSTWRLEVWPFFLGGEKSFPTGLQLQVWRSVLNNDTGGVGFSHPWYGRVETW